MIINRSLGPLLLLLGTGCSGPEPVEPPPAGQGVSGTLGPVATPGYSPLPLQSSPAGGLPGLSPPAAVAAISPDEAFRVDVTIVDPATLGVRFAVAECCYLYRDKTAFALSALDGAPLDGGLRLGAIDLPPGEATTDEFFGQTEIYRRSLSVRLPLKGALPISGFALNVTYQGCREKDVSICYEPVTRRFPIYGDAGRLTVGASSIVDKRRP